MESNLSEFNTMESNLSEFNTLETNTTTSLSTNNISTISTIPKTIVSCMFLATTLFSGMTAPIEYNSVIMQNELNNREYLRYDNAFFDDSNITKTPINGNIVNEGQQLNLKKLEQISFLPYDWNGNGANAFSIQLISKIKNLITSLTIQPEIFPTACDTIQLEYDKNDGAHLEIEIGENNLAEVYLIKSNGEDEYKSISSDISTINKVVEIFYE